MTYYQYANMTAVEAKTRRFRLLKPVKHGIMMFPAGTVVTVLRKDRGFHIEGPTCACCGVKVLAVRVHHSWLEDIGPIEDQS